MYIQLYKLTRRLYINWKSRLKEHLLLGKARQMIVMLKDTLNNSLLLIQNSIEWINLESNDEVHLRGLMWKEPIKRCWDIQHEEEEKYHAMPQTGRINQNLLLQTFWNQLKKRRRNELNSSEATLLQCFMLKEWSSKYQLYLIAQMDGNLCCYESHKIFNNMMWHDEKIWICCFELKHKLTHLQIRVNFRWLNISGNTQLKDKNQENC